MTRPSGKLLSTLLACFIGMLNFRYVLQTRSLKQHQSYIRSCISHILVCISFIRAFRLVLLCADADVRCHGNYRMLAWKLECQRKHQRRIGSYCYIQKWRFHSVSAMLKEAGASCHRSYHNPAPNIYSQTENVFIISHIITVYSL